MNPSIAFHRDNLLTLSSNFHIHNSLRMLPPLQLESKLLPSKTSVLGARCQNLVACGMSKIVVPKLPIVPSLGSAVLHNFSESNISPISISSSALLPITQVVADVPLAAPLHSLSCPHFVELPPHILSACHQIMEV